VDEKSEDWVKKYYPLHLTNQLANDKTLLYYQAQRAWLRITQQARLRQHHPALGGA